MGKIEYNGRQVELIGTYDTLVVGGGMSGASAAITAAKNGNHTLIVERFNTLGGTGVNALVTPMMPSFVEHGENFHAVEEALKENGKTTRDGMSEYVWFTAEDMADVLEQLYVTAGGKILYDTVVIDCVVEKEKIKYLIVSNVNGISALAADEFVDASGDAVLTRLCGVDVMHGDENGNNQISSLRFEMAGIDVDKYRKYCLYLGDEFSQLKEGYFFESAMVGGKNFKLEPVFLKGVEKGILKKEDLHYYQCFSLPGRPGCMSFNCPHITTLKDNTDAMRRSEAVIEGHQMIKRLVKFLTECMPGFEHAFLIKEAAMLGVRESYRLKGTYVLTEKDYLDRARFHDGIAKGDWYIDVHSADKGLVHQDKFQPGEYYEIPYRALINPQIKNIITVGRCISTSFLMQASIRIMPTVIDMGEAAGKACAYAKKNKIQLNEVDGSLLGKI